MADTEREAFEAWASNEFPDYFMDKDPVGDYYAEPIDVSWKGWSAALASRPAEVDDEGLPPLPESEFCAWLRNGQVVNAFTHGVRDKALWDRDGYWAKKGFDRAPLFTADQFRQGQRDAVAADRARGGEKA